MSKTKLTISKWKPLPVSYNERCLKPRADPASNVRGGAISVKLYLVAKSHNGFATVSGEVYFIKLL